MLLRVVDLATVYDINTLNYRLESVVTISLLHDVVFVGCLSVLMIHTMDAL